MANNKEPPNARIIIDGVRVEQAADGALRIVLAKFPESPMPLDGDKLKRWLMKQVRESLV